jgi:hypothetical protein
MRSGSFQHLDRPLQVGEATGLRWMWGSVCRGAAGAGAEAGCSQDYPPGNEYRLRTPLWQQLTRLRGKKWWCERGGLRGVESRGQSHVARLKWDLIPGGLWRYRIGDYQGAIKDVGRGYDSRDTDAAHKAAIRLVMAMARTGYADEAHSQLAAARKSDTSEVSCLA